MIKLNQTQFRLDLILPVFMASLMTLFLFYIDEGKYNFDGILRPDNFFFLLVYGGAFFGFQQLIKMGFEYFMGSGKSQRIISGALSALVFALLLLVFFLMIKPA